MSVPRGKFDEKAYRKGAQAYLSYLKCAWELSVELAEKCIAQPANPDDAEAVDTRRALVFDLSKIIFEKASMDARDIAAQEFWKKQGALEE